MVFPTAPGARPVAWPAPQASPAQMSFWSLGDHAAHGAVPCVEKHDDGPCRVPEWTNAEIAQLRVRVVALENLVITLLAQGSWEQLAHARDMATYISPRSGFTRHPVTLHAAAQMVHLAQRASLFQLAPPV